MFICLPKVNVKYSKVTNVMILLASFMFFRYFLIVSEVQYPRTQSSSLMKAENFVNRGKKEMGQF